MFKVKFKHCVSSNFQWWTECYIEKDGVPVASGVAQCSPSDFYSRPTGRKISLLRAAEALSVDDRKAVLSDWFAAHPKDARQKVSFKPQYGG